MNSVSLIGRHSKDPEFRTSESGMGICNFTLAVRNPFNKNGDADFIQCVAWGAAAELVADNHVKGNLMGIDGRISTRNYENNEGQRVWVTEVNVSAIHLIQTKDYNGQNNGNSNNDNENNRNSSSNGNNRNTSNGNNRNNSNGNNRNNNRNNNNGNRSNGSGNRNNRQNP